MLRHKVTDNVSTHCVVIQRLVDYSFETSNLLGLYNLVQGGREMKLEQIDQTVGYTWITKNKMPH